MRGKRHLIFTLVIFLTAPASASAYVEDYSPFLRGKPKSFLLRKLDVVDEGGDHVSFGVSRNGRSTILLKLFGSQDDDFLLLSVYNTSGRVVKESVRVSDSPFWRDAYTADLNRDGKPDYVVKINSVATGLGTYEDFIMFALSSGRGYGITTLHNWDSGSVLRDFVDVNKDGRCQFVHTSFTYVRDRRGRWHSQWVYNLLAIKGTRLALANNLYPIFPKWVWYTDKPNNRASPFISKAEAVRWSESEYQSFFWRADKSSKD